MRIFLAAPLTQMIDPASGRIGVPYRDWLESLIDGLERSGHDVFSAHVRERWGETLEAPTEALKADLDELRKADVVVAHVGNPPSPGVQFELGAAVVLETPVVLLLDREASPPYLIPALPSVVESQIIEFGPGSSIVDRVLEALNRADSSPSTG